MAKLILLRHFKSQWNLENRFTGWVDVPLAKNQSNKIKAVSKKVFHSKIDVIYTSSLFRNQNSVAKILEYSNKGYPIFIHLDKSRMQAWGNFKELHKNYTPIYITENLNERYYGKLQGQNKAKIIEEYGKEKTHLWRRGFKNRPPLGESLEDTFKRAIPFYRKYIEKDLKDKKNVLIVASHNSLRALIKHIEKIPDREIINLEVAYGGLTEYEFDGSLKLKTKK